MATDLTPLEKHAEEIVRLELADWPHAYRVAAAVPAGEARLAALLHDLIEDTDWSAKDLYDEGFPAEVVEAIVQLTRSEDETYEAYIARLCVDGSDMALRVKLADLGHNLERSRQDDLDRRVRRYERAEKAIIVEVLRRWYPG